ncbi:MAG: murein hydrolase activator EnvC family protein [Flavobacteriaceae bacterium]
MKSYLVVIGLLISFGLQAQNRSELEAQRAKIQAEIKQATELLGETRSSSQDVLSSLEQLNQQISRQENLISTLQKEVRLLDRDISKKEKQIEEKKAELQALKDQYAAMIYQAYKSKSKNARLLFILSADSFNQAMKRLEYMSQYSEFRKEQALVIEEKQEELLTASIVLKEAKKEQEQLLNLSKQEANVLVKDKESLKDLQAQIKKKEKFYVSQIKKKQKAEQRIDDQIKELIRIAIEESKRKARAKANAGGTPKKADSFEGFKLSPEAVSLQKNFESNKGKLPWPVERGVITRKYGTQAHPTLRGIKIKSNGIRIATAKGAKAKAVFNGKVLAVQVQSGGKKTVLIQHGNYITVYKNLMLLSIVKGDRVKTGQSLGTIFTDKVSGQTTLGFVLMKQVTSQNPQSWILAR